MGNGASGDAFGVPFAEVHAAAKVGGQPAGAAQDRPDRKRPTFDSLTCSVDSDDNFVTLIRELSLPHRRQFGMIDKGTSYALTGTVFANDRAGIRSAEEHLRFAAGKFYINDQPTGAVVVQQPFGGSRASGTNYKAGSVWNLVKRVSPRTMKQTFLPARGYRYPYVQPDPGDA